MNKKQVARFHENMTLNEVQLRNVICKWSSTSMAKPKVKTYGTTSMNPTLPTYFLHILQGQRSNAQVLIFVLNSLREAEFFIEFQRRI